MQPALTGLVAAIGLLAVGLKAGEKPVSAPWMQVRTNAARGQLEIWEADRPVLRYNFRTVEPDPDLLRRVQPGNLQYARARSDYIHPLYGLDGEELTRDWSPDHPHHRGIYWAWPEVDWDGKRGDLHALQRVFARPTDRCRVSNGAEFAEIDAVNLWKWEGDEAIVRERAILRAWRAVPEGRSIDLVFHFTARRDGVSLARRGTDQYGGLNLRFSAVRGQKIDRHADAPGASPRMSWGEISGVFADALQPSGVVILQHQGNPDHPGDWVEYPELNWLQPTFPASGRRYALKPDAPLVLRYRLWLHRGAPLSGDRLKELWMEYHRSVDLEPKP